MPTYLYRNGDTIVEFRARMGCAPKTVWCHGITFERDIRSEHFGQRSGDAWADHSSLALMVHPADVPKYLQDAREKGVTVEFDENGWAKFRSRSEWKRYCKAYGYHGLNEYDW